ncbi:UNKNOWN [Stylonychia lemnae]|uniref:Uncharacterized protein n=1 Tax=Stylonychia lemnae TaxID=5949 RepID=A0A078A9B1_STYLE|nr:UNKNOWN [Stylonychia lemnae]|eukprot:CDW78860.1 UNKNOWN [Stylonychia lemnae]
MESIPTTSTSLFNNKANNYFYENTEYNNDNSNLINTYNNVIFESSTFRNQQQQKRSEVSQEKLEKLRSLQDKVDMLEAEKESLVNQIYDLRQLLQKVNQQGEKKVSYIKNKNASLRSQKQSLLQALEISRSSATHLENISSYWSYNILPYCDDCDVSRDYDSAKNTSFGSNQDIPSLSTLSSCHSSQKSTECASAMMRCFEMEPESEHFKLHDQHLLCIQPQANKFICAQSNNKFSDRRRGTQGSWQVADKVVDVKTTKTVAASTLTTQQ